MGEMKITLIQSGPKFSLYGYVKENSCQVREFISTINDTYLPQIANIFERLCKHGNPYNNLKFRKIKGIDGEIYEIKTYKGIRILCFKSEPDNLGIVQSNSLLEPSLILIKGMLKPQEKILKREANKAEKLRRQYFNEPIEIIHLEI